MDLQVILDILGRVVFEILHEGHKKVKKREE